MNRLAKAAAALGNNTNGLEKMKLDEVIAKYPGGITVNWMDTRQGDAGEYIVFTFAEEPERYSTGSGDFKKLWDLWLEDFGGCMADLQEYMSENPIKLQVWKTRTKNRKTYTCVRTVREQRDEVKQNDCTKGAVKDDGSSRDHFA